MVLCSGIAEMRAGAGFACAVPHTSLRSNCGITIILCLTQGYEGVYILIRASPDLPCDLSVVRGASRSQSAFHNELIASSIITSAQEAFWSRSAAASIAQAVFWMHQPRVINQRAVHSMSSGQLA